MRSSVKNIFKYIVKLERLYASWRCQTELGKWFPIYILLLFIFSCMNYQGLINDKRFLDSISQYEEIAKQVEQIRNSIGNNGSGEIDIPEKGISIHFGTDSMPVLKTDEIQGIIRTEYYYVSPIRSNSLYFAIEKYVNEKGNSIFIRISYREKWMKLIWDSAKEKYVLCEAGP